MTKQVNILFEIPFIKHLIGDDDYLHTISSEEDLNLVQNKGRKHVRFHDRSEIIGFPKETSSSGYEEAWYNANEYKSIEYEIARTINEFRRSQQEATQGNRGKSLQRDSEKYCLRGLEKFIGNGAAFQQVSRKLYMQNVLELQRNHKRWIDAKDPDRFAILVSTLSRKDRLLAKHRALQDAKEVSYLFNNESITLNADPSLRSWIMQTQGY